MPAAKKSDDVFDEDISSFAKEFESPGNVMADDIMGAPKARPMPQQVPAHTQAREIRPSQKIPAFVSLAKYKELRLALRDIKGVSAQMHKLIEDLKANRDTGTQLLDDTVQGLEVMEDNIDKVKGVLRV